jgi:chemotaxis family two-component system response regulator Rcp1
MKATKMVQTEKLQPAEILMIEDSETDVLLAREALEQAKVVNNLHVLEDGASAMEYLHQRGKYSNATRPHLILLDLNLPKKSGQEVLAEIKADPALSNIPVVVLSTSKAEEDVLQSYNLRANCFITKPVDFQAFAKVIRSIENFWLAVVTLPESP